jgi:hypothetical protein
MTTCERCGEANPAEVHTCTPNYVDRRQWKYDPMTGEPLVDDWPLYSGLPQSEEGCAECGKKSSDGWALYCVKCSETSREWQGLTDEEMSEAYNVNYSIYKEHVEYVDFVLIYRAIEAKLKQKNA